MPSPNLKYNNHNGQDFEKKNDCRELIYNIILIFKCVEADYY